MSVGRGFVLLVCGGRDFADRDWLFRELDALHELHDVEFVLHGAAPGADSLAGEWARSRQVAQIVYPANWERYGRAAGMIRNRQMIKEKPDCVLAFPGGKGTENMVQLAERAGIAVLRLDPAVALG